MVKSGIPVPDTIPEGSKAFTICVPDDPFFYGVVAGAIKTMMFRYYWQGSEEQIDAATARMRRMYLEYQEQEGCMDCEQIIDCIEEDSDTRQALEDWFIEAAAGSSAIQQAINDAYNPIAPGQNMPPDVLGGSLTPENPGCNLDLLFGQVMTLITKMNQNNLDAFEIIEAESNLAERASTLVGAIPGLGILPIDEVIDYAQNLWSNDLFEAYAATDTEGYRNELACALFCMAQANGCALTLDMVLQYFGDRLGSNPGDTLSDIVIYLLAGTWSGTEVNDLFYYAQGVFMKYGNEFFGLTGLNPFKIWLKLAESNDTWPIICEECPTFWEFDVDFTTGLHGWTITSGQWVDGVGVTNDTGTAFPYAAEVSKDVTMPGGSTITFARILASSTTADVGASRGFYWGIFPAGTGQYVTPDQTGNYNIDVVPTVPSPDRIVPIVSNVVTPGDNVIRGLHFSGEGDNPFL